MDLWQLELFLAVIDQSTITKAAAHVGLSGSAVSMQLRNLAAAMRTDLFVKHGSVLLPTPAGLRLAEHAQALLQHVHQIECEFEADPAKDSRPFYLACGAPTLIYRLGRPLRLLRKQFPQVTMQITITPTEEMVAGILDRRFDLVSISLPFATGKLGVMPLYEEEMLILRPSTKAMRNWRVSAINPSELAAVPFLLYPKYSNMRPVIDRFFLDVGVRPKVAMEANDTEVIRGLVESGFGYSILPEFALHSGARFFQAFRVPGRRISIVQALAYMNPESPRALTISIAKFLRDMLAKEHKPGRGSRSAPSAKLGQ